MGQVIINLLQCYTVLLLLLLRLGMNDSVFSAIKTECLRLYDVKTLAFD